MKDNVLGLHRITFLVPSQRFQAMFSITRDVRLSVVDEFALRLVAICGRIGPPEFIRFFGFSSHEGTEVLRSLVARDLVATPDGLLALTDAGKQLFVRGTSETPRLVELEHRKEQLHVDLLDYRLVEASHGDPSLGRCVGLELPPSFNAAANQERVAQSFKEQFADYATLRGLDRETQLYAIQSITPRTRFQLPVEANVNLRFGAGVNVELELEAATEARTLRADANKWLQAISTQSLDDSASWSYLRSLFAWLPEDPPSVGSLARLQDSVPPGNELLLGSLSVPATTERVASFAARHSAGAGGMLSWLPAESELWLRSRSSWSALDSLASASGTDQSELLLSDGWSGHELFSLKKRFGEIRTCRRYVPSHIEIIMCGTRCAAVWAWLNLAAGGVPIPIGFISSLEDVLEKISRDLARDA